MIERKAFQMRVSAEDRAVFKAVAEHLERDQTTTIKLVMRKVAEELGVTPNRDDRKSEQKAA